MSGRGRGLTLPAWMTRGDAEASALEKPENSDQAHSVSANGTNGQFDNQPPAHTDAAAAPKPQEGYNSVAAWAQQPQMQQHSTEQANGGSTPQVYPQQTQGVDPSAYAGMVQPQPQPTPTPGMYAPPGQAPMGYMGAMGMPPTGYPPHMAAGYPPYGMPMPMPAYPGMHPGVAAMPGQFPAAAAVGRPPFQHPGAYPVQVPSTAARSVPGKAAAPASGIQDSNNDASAWSEHITEKDQRKYWYNKVTQKSTFDKPACLKTPEERSIPPCPWKEYATAEGKKYYHNGTDTVWDMPEEFRVWSERVEAASKKRRVAIAEPSGGAGAPSAGAGAGTKTKQQKKAAREEEAAAEPDIVYASREEAVNAFKSLLADRGIPSEMKFKEVQEICQADRRWNALKSAGDRKQNLAEYQTKKAKAEKEEKRERGKKLRDAFLLMLAENTQIDVNTRWRTAQSFLSSDNRYKAIEDDLDREDIFREFIQELDKKEREDVSRARREAQAAFTLHLQGLFESGKISRRAVWADAKPALSGALADVKYSTLSESDMRRALQDFVAALNIKYREELKDKRTAQRTVCEGKEQQFRSMLRRLSTNEDGSSSTAPVLTYLSEWKGVRELVEATVEHRELLDSYEAMNALNAEYDKTDDVRGSASRARGRSRSQSVVHGSSKRHRSKSVKDAFEAFMADLDDEYRADKKVFKAAMADAGIKILHDSKCEDILKALKSAAAAARDPDPALMEILSKREYIVRLYIEDTIDIRKEDFEEAQKLENRFIELLEDYYYRSDHVGITWEEAKDDLYKRSAYTNLERSERKRIFDKYMAGLADKLAAKKRPLTAPEGLRSQSQSSASDSSSDDSSVGHGKHKKSKKERKPKKSSDHRKEKRAREDSDSPEEGEISSESRKKSSRTK